MQNQTRCHFHLHVENTSYTDYTLPPPEDAASIQFGLVQVIRCLADKVYDTKSCALMLYALQLGIANAGNVQAEALRDAQPDEPTQAAQPDAVANPRDTLADDMLRRLRLIDPVLPASDSPGS